MAAKVKLARLVSEIHRSRTECNWSKALDVARQISSKSPALEALSILVLGESRLEKHLLDHPPKDGNIRVAQVELKEPQQQLQDALKASPEPDIEQQIVLLQGKLLYAMGNYTGALAQFEKVDLDNITVNEVTNRHLKIIGEAFAIKGLCLDKLPAKSTSKYQLAEREDMIMQCFERAGDISLLQLQDLHDKGKNTPLAVSLQATGLWNVPDNDTGGLGAVVETAIQRSPLLYIRKGKLSQGIGRFRELLRAVETRAVQGLRQILARQLAEVLLRGVCEQTYEPVPDTSVTQQQKDKPRTYQGDNLFTPVNHTEETLILLLISECMVTREAVLSRSTEHKDVREQTFHNTTAVYDLLTISLVRRAQFSMLTETFERAMKFSFDEYHIWYQFALSLICAKKYTRALLALHECHKLQPENPTLLLQTAQLCYDHLHLLDEGLGFSQRVVELGEDCPLMARGFIALGIGFSQKADDVKLQVQRQDYQRKALNAFIRAQTLDPNDYLAHYHAALQLSILRQIPEALKCIREALRLRCDHIHSLHLLALLLSASHQAEEALQLTEAALEEYPNNFTLLFTKSRLEEVVYGTEDALCTAKDMLQIWKDVYENQLENEHRGTGLIDRVTADTRSLVQLHLTELSDRDSGSVRAESVAASRVEQTLSEVASSMNSSYQPKQGPSHVWSLQAQIWLHLGELYLSLDRQDEAQACIQEAASVFPVSYMVSYMRGRLHEQKGELYEAKQYYENAVSINPVHVKSLQHLGLILHQLGNNHLAEKVLRDAVNANPTSSYSWQNLGTTLQAIGEFAAAGECLVTAVELEATSPVSPFTILPRSLDQAV